MKARVLLAVACAAVLAVGCGSAASVKRTQTTPARQRIDNEIVAMMLRTPAARALCKRQPETTVFDYRLVQRLVLHDMGAKIRAAGGRPYSVSVLFAAECQLRSAGGRP